MINKKTTYNCSVVENGFSNFYEIKPEETIFKSGELWYYLDKNENIRYLENEGNSLFKIDDIIIEKVSSLTKGEYLFLRKIYKLINCKFSIYKGSNNIFYVYNEKEKLLTINSLSNPFNYHIALGINYLEEEGVFNDNL